MMLNLSKSESRLFCATVIVIAAWLGQSLVYKPVAEKWQRLDERITADSLKLEKSGRLISREEQIQEEYESIAAPLKMSGSAEEEMAKFLGELESLANSTGAHINEIKPMPSVKEKLYRKFFAEVEAEGEMAQIAGFMKCVQESKSVLSIEKLSLGSKQPGNAILRCRMVISKIAIK